MVKVKYVQLTFLDLFSFGERSKWKGIGTMMKRKTKVEQDHEKHRQIILMAATEMVKEVGFEGISIRKLAEKIEYSPTVIYHYFKNRDELIASVMGQGYRRMFESLKGIQLPDDPMERLSHLIKKHIELVMDMPEVYKNVQLSEIEEVRMKTSFLHQQAAKENLMLRILATQIGEIFKKSTEDSFVEQTAQVIVAATLGIEIRLIIEKIEGVQREKLMSQFVKMMCASIEVLKEGE